MLLQVRSTQFATEDVLFGVAYSTEIALRLTDITEIVTFKGSLFNRTPAEALKDLSTFESFSLLRDTMVNKDRLVAAVLVRENLVCCTDNYGSATPVLEEGMTYGTIDLELLFDNGTYYTVRLSCNLHTEEREREAQAILASFDFPVM